jgi:hypothetical protein
MEKQAPFTSVAGLHLLAWLGFDSRRANLSLQLSVVLFPGWDSAAPARTCSSRTRGPLLGVWEMWGMPATQAVWRWQSLEFTLDIPLTSCEAWGRHTYASVSLSVRWGEQE